MRNRPIIPHEGDAPAHGRPLVLSAGGSCHLPAVSARGPAPGNPLVPSAGHRLPPPAPPGHGTGAGGWPAARHGNTAGGGGGTSGGRGPRRLHVTASGHGLVVANLWRNYKGVLNDTEAFIGEKLHPASPVPWPWQPTAPRLDLLLPPAAPDLPHGRPDPWALATSFEAAALPHQRDLLLSLRFELPQGLANVDCAGFPVRPWHAEGIAPERREGTSSPQGPAGSAPMSLHRFWEKVRAFVLAEVVDPWGVPAVLVLHVPAASGMRNPPPPHVHALVFARELTSQGWGSFSPVTSSSNHPGLVKAWGAWR